jgi:hypothetical protein
MAIAKTFHTAETYTSSTSTTMVSASFTPSNSSLIVVLGFWSDSRTSSWTLPTISGGGLSWDTRVSRIAASQYQFGYGIWTAPVTTGVSMTATLTSGASWYDNGGSMAVYSITGHNSSSPVNATAESFVNTSYSGAKSINFSTTPAASSILLGGGIIDEDGSALVDMTSGTGWTSDHGAVGDTWIMSRFQNSTGASTSQLAFANIQAFYQHAIAGIAINEAPIGTPRSFTIIYY